VRKFFGWERFRPMVALLALMVGLSMLVAACGDDDDEGSAGGGAQTTAAPKPAANASKCGLGNGKKAAGAPIKLGAIA
jgi:hypothetical protein